MFLHVSQRLCIIDLTLAAAFTPSGHFALAFRRVFLAVVATAWRWDHITPSIFTG
jgi:hypothetical protein